MDSERKHHSPSPLAGCTSGMFSSIFLDDEVLIIFKAEFREWSKANNFESKLPDDIKLRKEAFAKVTERQKTLNSHLKDMSKEERVIKYSELVFERASVDWLIGTDQVGSTN